MLSDTRDVYFQRNPFATLDKRASTGDVDVDGGSLYFFAVSARNSLSSYCL